mmetsp:Transcript_38162/g.85875  ORF Transcript_38162/g.85875 Transcript_38162/m.85875 type:complete len:121 (-) Transcript_38162:26-388(-)
MQGKHAAASTQVRMSVEQALPHAPWNPVVMGIQHKLLPTTFAQLEEKQMLRALHGRAPVVCYPHLQAAHEQPDPQGRHSLHIQNATMGSAACFLGCYDASVLQRTKEVTGDILRRRSNFL